MKRFSVKTKVTLWYTSFMILLVLFMLGFLFFIGEHVVSASSQDNLINVVKNSYSAIEYDDGKLDIDDDLEDSTNALYLSIYNEKGVLQYGQIPNIFETPLAFTDGTMQTHKKGDTTWYIYDSQFHISGYGNVWVRGIASLNEASTTFDTLLKLTTIAMPFLVLIAIFMGYLITKRAFAPITKIQEAANQIGKDKDLSKRINLGKGKDEIYTLANTFDSMFERLERAFEKERQFTTDASHELRTPTAVIISQCEYSLENAKTSEEMKEALESVLDEARRMASLIAQLLTLARADHNHIDFHLEEFNISELSEIIISQQLALAKDKNITITTAIEPNIFIYGDETMIMRALLNLTENGIRYGRFDGELQVSIQKKKNTVYIQIKDNGIGIDETHLAKIWERFYQVDPARTSSKEGMGLGLSMVKWIVEAHGGTTSVESTIDVGTTFSITLPIK